MAKEKKTQDEFFNDEFTKCIRGELADAGKPVDPRGGYSEREGYGKKPNPGQGPYEGSIIWHGLDDIGKGQKKK